MAGIVENYTPAMEVFEIIAKLAEIFSRAESFFSIGGVPAFDASGF
ncbi:MAG TPA: hypothetical protein PKH94_11510 [Bacteroidales bacterium]|nr:hypothetical protein [Bacteroidales bacterium]HNS47857.1 hypothetical protein [Bacteroidales bacterium]